MVAMLAQNPTDAANAAIAAGYRKANLEKMRARIREMDKCFTQRQKDANEVEAVMANRFGDLVLGRAAAAYHPDTFRDMFASRHISTKIQVMRRVLKRINRVWPGATYSLESTDTASSAPAPSGPMPAQSMLPAPPGPNGAPAPAPMDDGADGMDTPQEQAVEDDKRLPEFIKHAQFDSVMKRIAQREFIHPGVYAFPQTVYSDRKGKRVFEIRVMAPNVFDLLPSEDSTSEYDALVLYYCEAGEPEQRTVWTARTWATYEKGDKERENSTDPWEVNGWVLVEGGPNPYGHIPGVFFNGDSVTLWNEDALGKMLLEYTLDACVADTQLNQMRGAQIKVLSVTDDFPSGQVLAQARPIGQGAGVGVPPAVLDLQTNIPAFSETYVTSKAREACANAGYDATLMDDTAVPQSGEAWKMKHFSADKESEERRPTIKARAVDLYWQSLLRLSVDLSQPSMDEMGMERVLPIAGFDGGWMYDPSRPPEANVFNPPSPADVLPPYRSDVPPEQQPVRLSIDVRDAVYPQLAQEQRDQEAADLAASIISRVDIAMKRDPDLSFDEAKERIIANAMTERELNRLTGVGPRPALTVGIAGAQPPAAGAVMPQRQQMAAPGPNQPGMPMSQGGSGNGR